MEQTLFEKFDKIVCPINIAKPPTVLENLSGLIICFLRMKSSKVIYDFSAKNITLWGCFFVLCRANRLGPRSFRLRNEQTLRADSSLNRALGAKSLQAPATRTKQKKRLRRQKRNSPRPCFFTHSRGLNLFTLDI